MTTPAVLYNTVPVNLDCLDDINAIHDLNPIPIPNPKQSSSAPNEEEEEDAYDTIFEDDDGFVLVPTSVQVPIFDEDTACVVDGQTLEDVANDSEEWVEVEGDPSHSSAWFLSILPDRVGDAAKSGVEWFVTTKTILHRRILISAASSQTQTTYPWATMEEPSTTVTSEIHGELCRLMLPGPVVVFGDDSMCVSLTGDEVMRPQVTASSKPTTIMVSAYDILAASSSQMSPSRTPSSMSLTRSRILESSCSGMLMSVMHYSGTKIVKSTKKRTKKIVKAGGTAVQSVGHTIVRLERRFQMIGKTSDLLIDGYERFLGPIPSNDFEDGDYTIELTS